MQSRYIDGDGVPEYIIINSEITVYQGIAVSCKQFPGDFRMFTAVCFRDMFGCFTDDLKGADKGISADAVLLVLLMRESGKIRGDKAGLLVDVTEKTLNANITGFHAASAPVVQIMASRSTEGRIKGLSHFLLTRSIFLPNVCSRCS